MIGAMVIVLVAAGVMLVAGCGVMAVRLVGAGRRLRDEVGQTRARLQPMVAEFREQTEIARIESQAVRQGLAILRGGDGRSGG